MTHPVFDLAIIGGGINGCGIARDAAGRGLSVFLCEQGDLASGTSSASTKLIHGGLRYLEYYEFRLVREALSEREILLNSAPHIISPLRFILPHHKGLRPAWLIRFGLFIYDHIGARKLLPPTTSINLRRDIAGKPLKHDFGKGFEYSDCWVMDSRLVILNALAAKEKGAEIRTRSPLLGADRSKRIWQLHLLDLNSKEKYTVCAKTLVNASGPWLDTLREKISHRDTGEHIRLVKGSHIIVPNLFEHQRAYIFQNNDGRIIFAIPYEDVFTLIGTTDIEFRGDPGNISISDEEIHYLCEAASEYFKKEIKKDDVISSFSGVRPLFDDGTTDAKAATRDYVLKLDQGEPGDPPLLSIYGGKITTYRTLAESVIEKLRPYLDHMTGSWTANTKLPGGDFRPEAIEEEMLRLHRNCPFLEQDHVTRLLRTYGTTTHEMTKNMQNKEDLGSHFGHNLYSFEVDHLLKHEWAQTGEDILWRRTRLGLFLNSTQVKELDSYILSQLTGK